MRMYPMKLWNVLKNKKAQFYLILIILLTLLFSSYLLLRPEQKQIVTEDFSFYCENLGTETTKLINYCVVSNCSNTRFTYEVDSLLSDFQKTFPQEKLNIILLIFKNNQTMIFKNNSGVEAGLPIVYLKKENTSQASLSMILDTNKVLLRNYSSIIISVRSNPNLDYVNYTFNDEFAGYINDKEKPDFVNTLIYSVKDNNVRVCVWP